jgi:Tol biopolymer transport system component
MIEQKNNLLQVMIADLTENGKTTSLTARAYIASSYGEQEFIALDAKARKIAGVPYIPIKQRNGKKI